MLTPNFSDDWRPWLGERLGELAAALRFLTRLPLPHADPVGGAALAQSVWAFPLAGIAVGVIGAVVYALAHRLGLPPWPAAALALAATLAVTGALHEDGLADTADGFGGGATREAKLEIMRDARIGAYGVCALVLSLLLRIAAIASLGRSGAVAAALIAAHAAGRATIPAVMLLVHPARNDGLAYAAGRPSGTRSSIAAALGAIVLIACLGPARAIIAAMIVVVAVALLARLSAAQIGGQTGDVLGAVEQVAEIAVLLAAVG
jgi:adenosylcobinamide-GDP ribazoletransferase